VVDTGSEVLVTVTPFLHDLEEVEDLPNPIMISGVGDAVKAKRGLAAATPVVPTPGGPRRQ
jgi:hypothetical protein